MAPMAVEHMSWMMPFGARRDEVGFGSASNGMSVQASADEGLFDPVLQSSFSALSIGSSSNGQLGGNGDAGMAPWNLPSLEGGSSTVGGNRPPFHGGGGMMDPHAPQFEPLPSHHLATGGAGVLISSPGGRFQIKRCQGFVRCDMDIESEVVGWVIGKNGSTIKDMKHKTGCNMWVDQRALKLTITGPDVATVENAAKGVEAYIAAAPIKAGAVEAAVTRNLECPPHLLDTLGDRATIARIVKETRAQVVVNKKMMRIIIRGNPHAVDMASDKVAALIAQALVDEQEQRGRAEAKAYQQLLAQHQRWLAARAAGSAGTIAAGGGHDERDRHFSSEVDSELGDAESVLSYASLGSHGQHRNGGGGGVHDYSPSSSAPVSPRGRGGPSWSLFSGGFSGTSALHDAAVGGGGGSGETSPVLAYRGTPSTSGAGTPVGSPGGAAAAASPLPPPGLHLTRSAAFYHGGPSSPPLAPVAEEGEPGGAGGGSADEGSSAGGPASAAPRRRMDEALAELLEELGLGKYGRIFAESEVDLDALALMEEGDLADLSIPKGPRLKILNAIRRQKRSSSRSSEESA